MMELFFPNKMQYRYQQMVWEGYQHKNKGGEAPA